MFLKVGHRGASAYEVENTLKSFQKAIELGANAVELDVRQSVDGALVVIHDDNLKRVFGMDMKVARTTLKDLEHASDDGIPTLQKALHFIDRKVEKILVELKERGYEKEVLHEIRKHQVHDRVIVVSFRDQSLSEVRRLDSTIETGLIYSKHHNPTAAAIALRAQYLIPSYRFVLTRNVADAHGKNLKVIVWTINTATEAKQYREKGVDGIASDRPDIL